MYRSYGYNNSLQVNSIIDAQAANHAVQLLNLAPDWGSTANNGTLQGITQENGGPGYPQFLTFKELFTYDGVNRLLTATGKDANSNILWSQNYGYDQYGNQWLSSYSGITPAGNTPTSNVYDPTTNRGGSASNYDSSGNAKAVNGNTLIYNGENQIVSVNDPIIGGTETFGYDGLGQRVVQNLPSSSVVYVYDAFGQLAAEYHSAAATTPQCSTCYLSADWLGSMRLVTDPGGNIISRHDFTPFGQEIPAGTAGRDSSWGHSDNIRSKFTGQLRDTETGMDYFIARYYGNALGRFVSPDPANAGANASDPQTWNGYAYVRNNPLAFTDPSGMSWWGDIWGSISGFFGGSGCGADFCATGTGISDIGLAESGGAWGIGGAYLFYAQGTAVGNIQTQSAQTPRNLTPTVMLGKFPKTQGRRIRLVFALRS